VSAAGADRPVPRLRGSLERSGERIHYEVIGAEGLPWLVLCHGAGGNHAIWFQQVAWFCRSFRVVTWDQRGFGLSTNREGRASPAVAAADLVALMEHLEADRVHLVGQSMGGWAVMGATLSRPDLVASLVLADTLAGFPMPDWVEGRVLPRRPEPLLGDHPALARGFAARRPDLALLYQQLGAWGLPDRERAGALAGLTTTAFTLEELAGLRCPVLLLVGAEDEIFPPEWIRSVGAAIPGSRVEIIPGAGHSPYFERADRWNVAVTGHLARALGG
jgi:3-oxoadipate enol-lactonase